MNKTYMKAIVTLLMLIIAVTYSCDHSKIYESNSNIPSDGWERAEKVRFQMEITDTVSPCNVYIHVRNNSNYKYMALWLFVDVYPPSGNSWRDTVKIMLADHRGKWLGHGLGSKFDTRVVLRQNTRFTHAGKYVFEYEQAMRDEPLTGIDDIGLRIETM